ncbi:MAG: 5'-nucleotidase C-terminal domain-containing protein [Mogibacterium sp.]|nr:5'-nucleotidase C-terminal domain-containing protein [Mogibacterium sp.]
MKASNLLKRIIAAVLAVMMMIAMTACGTAPSEDESTPAADNTTAETETPAAPAAAELAEDYTGKTVILQSNDVHGAIDRYQYMAGLRDELEKRGADVILADSGDYSQGSPYVNFYKGSSAIRMMNKTGYDVATLGNHEFDYSSDNLFKITEQAEFSILCADLYNSASGEEPFGDVEIIDKGDLKVGFFGLDTPESKTKADPKKLGGYDFYDNESDPTIYERARQCVDKLKGEGADVIVCICHLGVDAPSEPYCSYNIYDETPGIDLILDGHSHTVMTEGAGGTPIMSTGNRFRNIGMAVIDEKSKEVESRQLYEITEDSYSDEEVLREAHAIMAEVDAAYGYKVGESLVELNGATTADNTTAPFTNGNRDGETNLGDFVADAVIWKLTEDNEGLKLDADKTVAVLNGGGNRDWIHKGDVTRMDIHSVWPFGNSLCVVTVTGAELLEVLEAGTFCTPGEIGGFPQVAGIDYTIDTTKEYDAQDECYPGSTYYGPASIQRVRVNSINGQPFDERAEYYVLTIDFCAHGGDTYYALTRAASILDTGIMLDEAVNDYLEAGLGGVIDEEYADAAGRIHIITEENKGTEDAEQAEADSSGSEAADAGQETEADSSDRENADLAVDGHWGPATTRATQRALSVTEDGSLGPETVKAIQKKVGAPEDGHWGPATTRAMQKFLGIEEDGSLGPETVRAWQEWCRDAA